MTGWLKKIGWAGLIFYTVKGLLWIAVFALGWAIRACAA